MGRHLQRVGTAGAPMQCLNSAVSPVLPSAALGGAARGEVWCQNSTIVSGLHLTKHLGVFWVGVVLVAQTQVLVGGHTECRIIWEAMTAVPHSLSVPYET